MYMYVCMYLARSKQWLTKISSFSPLKPKHFHRYPKRMRLVSKWIETKKKTMDPSPKGFCYRAFPEKMD